MKRLAITLGLLLFLSCEQKRTPDLNKNLDNTSDLLGFDWILGKWKRINADTTYLTFEEWYKDSIGNFFGHGYVLDQTDTVWQEKMELQKFNSNWLFVVKTVDNSDVVTFRLTESSNSSFNVENQEHDFPKLIKYWHEEGMLFAQIEGDTAKITFEFSRLN